MALTPAQLTLLRDRHPHFASVYISIFAADTDTVTAAGAPGVVYAGTVNGAHNRGARDITCANLGVPVGNIANVDPGQTVLVGTFLGDDSISKRRLRHRAQQVLTLDANGVVWTAGDFITVIENYEFWPVFPKIDDTSPYVMYKDDNITYGLATYTDFDGTSANLQPFPVAIMGPPWAGWLVSGTVTISLEGGGSYGVAPGATISTYLWTTTGGAIANANVASTTITFTTCGVYWVTLSVTDSNGRTQRTRRPFFVHDVDNCPPFYDFNANVHLTTDQGNDLQISALRDVDFAEIPDEALVVLWADEYFRDANNPPDWTVESIGGYTGREHIKFVGYLDKESIEADPENAGDLSFEAYSINKIMADTTMWGIALNDVLAVPSTWYEYQNINTARAIHHLWRWHSTLFMIADVRLPFDVNLEAPGDSLTCHGLRRFAIDFPEGNLISQARVAAWDQGIFANIGCDRQGIVYAEVDPLMIAEGAANADERGVVDEVQSITNEDWYEEITLTRNERFRRAWAILSGLNWDGATKTPLISVMPGEDPTGAADYDSTPEVFGDVREEGNKLLATQATANEKVGLLWARGNRALEEIRVPEFAGNYSHVDVYPQSFYRVDIPPNKRGLSIADTRRGIPRQVTVSFMSEGGSVNVSTVLEPETIDVVDGVPGKYPTTIPDPDPDNPPKYPEPEDGERTVYDDGLGDGIFWSRDEGGAWAQRIGSRAGADLNSRWAYTDPWGPSADKKGSFDPEKAILWDMGQGFIFRSDDAGRYWTDVTPQTDPPNTWNDSPAPTSTDLTYEMGVANWHTNKDHFVIAWYQDSGAYRGYLLRTTNDGQSWIWYPLGSAAAGGAAAWNYLTGQICDGFGSVTESAVLPCLGRISDIELTDTPNILGAPDGAGTQYYVPVWFVGGAACAWQPTVGDQPCLGIFDTGFWWRLTNAVGWVHPVDGLVNSRYWFNNTAWDWGGGPNTPRPNYWAIDEEMGCGVFPAGVDGIGSQSRPAPGSDHGNLAHFAAGDLRRWVFISVVSSGTRDGGAGQTTGSHLVEFDSFAIWPAEVEDEIRPISVALDFEEGRYLYMTTWEGGALNLRVYDTQVTLAAPMRYVRLGVCSRAEFDNRDYFAGVRCLYDPAVATYSQRIIIHGRWNDGAVRHLFRSNDAGATLVDIGLSATWLTRWAGAAVWEDWDTIRLCMNGATDYLTGTLDGGTNWNAPASNAINFEVEFAMTMHGGSASDRTIVIGNRAGNNVRKQTSPYTGAWVDITPGAAVGTDVGACHWIYNEIP